MNNKTMAEEEVDEAVFNQLLAESRKYSITTVKPSKSPTQILYSNAAGVHYTFYKEYLRKAVHNDMLNLYVSFDPSHRCKLC